jgi:hypothetical protein
MLSICMIHSHKLHCLCSSQVCAFTKCSHCHWRLNPSSCTVALGSTQPLTEMSTRNISGGKRQPVHRADNLTTFMCWLSGHLVASDSWKPRGPVQAWIGITLLFLTAFLGSRSVVILSIDYKHPLPLCQTYWCFTCQQEFTKLFSTAWNKSKILSLVMFNSADHSL